MRLETYIKYLEEHQSEINDGKMITIQVTDSDIYEQKVVQAIVARTAEKLPGSEDLWIKNDREELDPIPWKIKIIADVDQLFERRSRGLGVGG